MTEPLTGTAASFTVFLLTIAGLFSGIHADVLMGSFAGAVVFIMTAQKLSVLQKVVFFLTAFVAGCVAAKLVADLIAIPLPASIIVSEGIGALIAGAISMKLLQWLIVRAEHPEDLLNIGGKK